MYVQYVPWCIIVVCHVIRTSSFLKAQRCQELLGLGERGGSPACHLHGEGRQHEGGLQTLLRWSAEGRLATEPTELTHCQYLDCSLSLVHNKWQLGFLIVSSRNTHPFRLAILT